jgi:hypothetical protein
LDIFASEAIVVSGMETVKEEWTGDVRGGVRVASRTVQLNARHVALRLVGLEFHHHERNT